MAAQAIKSALPSHLKPSNAGNNGDEAEFAKRHHGKTRSHMVSLVRSSSNVQGPFS
jgi:UTP--glucose-1-phosphate uridylyltransferase